MEQTLEQAEASRPMSDDEEEIVEVDNGLLTMGSIDDITGTLDLLQLSESATDADDQPQIDIVCYTSESPCLTANLGIHEEWQIRLVNMDLWKLRASFETLDFQVVGEELEESYKELDHALKTYYANPVNEKRVSLTLDTVISRKIEFAVVKTEDGEFKRVQILHIDHDDLEWEDYSDSDDSNTDTIQADLLQATNSNAISGDFPCVTLIDIRVIDADANVNLRYGSCKWFYLTEIFSRLPFRTRECGLADSEIFLDFFEFVDSTYDALKDGDIFQCKVDYVNENELPFVTLCNPKFKKTANLHIFAQIIHAIPAPSVPPVGEAYDDATLCHYENNGEVFLQFKESSLYELFQNVSTEVTKDDYLNAKARGPYPLRNDIIYMAPFEGECYRCIRSDPTIHDDKPDFIDILFIDYGNRDIVDPQDMVPCHEVDEVLAMFPRMAIRAHLRNIAEVRWDLVVAKLPGNATFVVETIKPSTPQHVAYVELMAGSTDSLLMLSATIVQANFARNWTDERLPGPTAYPNLLFHCKYQQSRILMGDMDWSTDPSKVVKAEIGAILHVEVIAKDYKLTIRPVNALKKISELKSRIEKWYFWRLASELTEGEYKFYQWRNFELGNNVLVTQYIGLDILNRAPAPLMIRGRLIDYDVNAEAYVVLDVDRGVTMSADGSTLHCLSNEFCQLPAQGALFSSDTLDGKMNNIPDSELIGQKFLVKVESVDFETGRKSCGRCIIKGRLYHVTSIKNKNGVGIDLNNFTSMTPFESQDVDLENPLTEANFTRLGSFCH